MYVRSQMVSDNTIGKVLSTEDPNRIPETCILSTAFTKTLEKYPVVK